MRHATIIGLAALLCACAARAPRQPLRTLAEADGLAAIGCYACLVEALDIYEAHLAQARRPEAARGAFRASLLLALREKEIGLPAVGYLERARARAASLPPVEDAPLLVALADAIAWDYAGLTKEFSEEFIRTRQAIGPQVAGWRARLKPRLADPFVAYIDASLACSYGDYRARDASLDAIQAQHGGSPLVKYRLGACVQRRRELLEDVLDLEPRYAEAHLFLGRYALADASRGRGMRKTIAPHLTAAYEAFPRSPSATVALAGMYRTFNKLKDAVRYYDETLALVPAHREALLGRIISLTYLQRPDEAIADATRLIELGEWYIGDAFYWRAYNRRLQKRLDEARDDAESAKQTAGLRPDVFLLAGIIYFERGAIEAASADLEKTMDMDRSSAICDAAWYLGLVRSEQKKWEGALALFPRAAGCYRTSADAYRADLTEMQKADVEPEDAEEVGALASEYQRAIDDQLVSEARSYYNAAYSGAQLGRRTEAIGFATRAAEHAIMKEKAAELIAALNKPSR